MVWLEGDPEGFGSGGDVGCFSVVEIGVCFDEEGVAVGHGFLLFGFYRTPILYIFIWRVSSSFGCSACPHGSIPPEGCG